MSHTSDDDLLHLTEEYLSRVLGAFWPGVAWLVTKQYALCQAFRSTVLYTLTCPLLV
jgi:hypothetical protein